MVVLLLALPSQATFDLMIGSLVDAGRFAEAFEYAERSRARDLLGLLDTRAHSASHARPIRVACCLPVGTVLIEYGLPTIAW